MENKKKRHLIVSRIREELGSVIKYRIHAL